MLSVIHREIMRLGKQESGSGEMIEILEMIVDHDIGTDNRFDPTEGYSPDAVLQSKSQ